MTGRLFRVLRAGIRQRVADGWRRPAVGDLINVSDQGAPLLLRDGWIEPAVTVDTRTVEGFQGFVSAPTHFLVGESGPEPVHITPASEEDTKS